MNIYINILCITVICVLISDIIQFWTDFSPYIKMALTKGKIKSPIDFKLFQCSLCQSHWLNLIYILCLGKFTIFNYMVILLLSTATPLIKDTIILITELIKKVLNGTYERFIR